jgi:hypothetical protein
MTPTEMETVLQNLDARLLRVEQVLPTLATKRDLDEVRRDFTELLRGEIRQTTERLTADIERSANGLRVLIEANRSDHQLLAEHVLEILTRLRGES